MLLNEMEIFYYVVRLQSFSKAARHLGVSTSFVTKHINQLEDCIKTKLLTRSTRQLNLTEGGELFYQYCSQVVTHATEGFETLSEMQSAPMGTLRISAPPAFGSYVLPSVIDSFRQQYPDINLDISLTSKLIDMIKEGYDLVLRSAILEDSNLIVRSVMEVKQVICASPKYLQAHGQIKQPKQLSEHTIAIYPGVQDSSMVTLYQNQHEHKQHIQVGEHLKIDQMELSKKLAIMGTCVAILPEFMVSAELEQGQLIHCLKDYSLPTHTLYALYPNSAFKPLKMTAFLEILMSVGSI